MNPNDYSCLSTCSIDDKYKEENLRINIAQKKCFALLQPRAKLSNNKWISDTLNWRPYPLLFADMIA